MYTYYVLQHMFYLIMMIITKNMSIQTTFITFNNHKSYVCNKNFISDPPHHLEKKPARPATLYPTGPSQTCEIQEVPPTLSGRGNQGSSLEVGPRSQHTPMGNPYTSWWLNHPFEKYAQVKLDHLPRWG